MKYNNNKTKEKIEKKRKEESDDESLSESSVIDVDSDSDVFITGSKRNRNGVNNYSKNNNHSTSPRKQRNAVNSVRYTEIGSDEELLPYETNNKSIATNNSNTSSTGKRRGGSILSFFGNGATSSKHHNNTTTDMEPTKSGYFYYSAYTSRWRVQWNRTANETASFAYLYKPLKIRIKRTKSIRIVLDAIADNNNTSQNKSLIITKPTLGSFTSNVSANQSIHTTIQKSSIDNNSSKQGSVRSTIKGGRRSTRSKAADSHCSDSESISVEDESESAVKYCFCDRAYVAGDGMICCDIAKSAACKSANNWYHFSCVGITEAEADSIKEYCCKDCK